jgi:hypothetical protein
MLHEARKQRSYPCWLTAAALATAIIGQVAFWSCTINSQLTNRYQSPGTASWLSGTVIFLTITARQNVSTFFRVFRTGTTRQIIETGATATMMIASWLAGVSAFWIYCARNAVWYWLDTCCLFAMLSALFVFSVQARFRKTTVSEHIAAIGIFSRAIPRLLYGIGSVFTGVNTMGTGTIIGGQLIATARTFSVWVSIGYDSRATCAFKTEAWGNLATSSFLTITWIWVAFFRVDF